MLAHGVQAPASALPDADHPGARYACMCLVSSRSCKCPVTLAELASPYTVQIGLRGAQQGVLEPL